MPQDAFHVAVKAWMEKQRSEDMLFLYVPGRQPSPSVQHNEKPVVAESKSRKNFLPYLALGVGILSLSFSALFVRWAAAPGPVMGFYRIGLAVLILTPALIWRRYSSRQRQAERISLAGTAVMPGTVLQPGFLRKEILIFPALGGVFSGIDHAVWNTSLSYTTAANSTLLGNTAPLWVALFAWIYFRERLRVLFWVGLALTMLGATTVLGADFLRHPVFGWGDLLALSSGVFYAGYYIATQRGRQHLDTLSYIWIAGLCSTLVLLAMCLVLKLPLTGYPPRTYLFFFGAALLPQITGYLAVGYALGHLPASVVSPTMICQPVLTALLAIPLLGEMLQASQWLGGMAVLAGIFLVHRSRD